MGTDFGLAFSHFDYVMGEGLRTSANKSQSASWTKMGSYFLHARLQSWRLIVKKCVKQIAYLHY